MGLKDTVNALIDANIYANGEEKITGQGLNATLKGVVEMLPTTDEILTGINGTATESNGPNTAAGFFRYIVTAPITAGSAWGIEVTQAELNDNWVFFNVKDGVITKDSKPQQVGKSAYEVAVANGFVGTEAEWLDSLNGTTINDVNQSLETSGLLTEAFVTTDQIKPAPFGKYTPSGVLDSKTHNAWYVGKSTKKVNVVYVPLTSVHNGSTPLTDSVFVRIGVNGVFIFSTEITLAQMAAQGIDTQAGTEAKTMYKLDVPEFTINSDDVIYVAWMAKSPTDKLGFVYTSTLTNEWVNGYNSRDIIDINALSAPPNPEGSGFAYNVYFKYKEAEYVSNVPAVVQNEGNSQSDVMSQKAVTDKLTDLEGSILNKAEKHYRPITRFNNEGQVNSVNTFWMNANDADPFKYAQFNIKAKGKMILKSLDFAGAYVTTGLTLGTGNVSLRIYTGVTFSGNQPNFSTAILIRKATVPISEFYSNSTKDSSSAGLKSKLLSGDIGYTTFEFTPLEVEKDDELYLFFGADDDGYYQNTPKAENPTMRISLVQSDSFAMSGGLFGQASPSTFFTTAHGQLVSDGGYPVINIEGYKETTFWNEGTTEITTRDVYKYIGAFNTVLDALFTAKPTARVLIIGHHTTSGVLSNGQGGDYFKPQNDVQRRIADYWNIQFLPLWEKLGWKNNETVNTYQAWVPDEIHPYSNTTKVSTAIGDMSIADVRIKDFVKDAMKPIFGEHWAGKKVATYGTSIPYGGKYTMLAAVELGGTAQNYCSSGSYLRRGKTDNIPVANSFTDGADVTYRNYIKDMVNLIGTGNEPDLFVFDFGINDFNLDSSDFDVTY